jgi:DNA repair exonuclease SbcCD ATPase subunit
MAEQAQEMVVDATPKKKAFMEKPSTHEERIKKDEEELKQLMEEQEGETESVKETKAEDEEEPKSAEERTFKKRYGDLRRHSQEKEKDFQRQLDDLKSQLSKATKKEMKLPKSDEDINEWAKEYPDVAAIVETIAAKKAREQSEDIEKRIKEIDERDANSIKEKAEVELLRLHPDFADIRESDEFHDWAEEQPKWVQNALYENDNDAKSAARAIDLYKADKGLNKKKEKSNDAGAAKAVSTKSKTSVSETNNTVTFKESTVDKMSADEYAAKADVIMEAIRSGNFIYDLSGSAR